MRKSLICTYLQGELWGMIEEHKVEGVRDRWDVYEQRRKTIGKRDKIFGERKRE